MDEINANLIKKMVIFTDQMLVTYFLGGIYSQPVVVLKKRVMGRQFEEEKANTISQEEFTQKSYRDSKQKK
ncbi:MAG: hypothetical protein CM15mV126_440 [uncultured marine virus]|nr:MAG: hypothetical protein CM15mV126_440 [uncultured marine virus]